MKKRTRYGMYVASTACVAALATAPGVGAGVGVGVVKSYDFELRADVKPNAKTKSKPEPKSEPESKPKAPEIPQPENGVIEGVSLSTLNAIAGCESGGDPAAVNAAGYYGKYQFDLDTWAAVGGTGNPAKASEAEQDYRAAILYSQAGSSPWPVCGV